MVFVHQSEKRNKNIMEKEKKINIEDGNEKENVQTENLEGQENSEKVEETKDAEVQEGHTPEEDPKEIIANLQAQLDEIKNRHLYLQAEYQNYRHRTTKEKADLLLNGSERTVNAVLPVMDDMERAIANATNTEDPTVLKEGMILIYQKFEKALEGIGVKKIKTQDADFDTDLHEAVAMVPGMGDDKKGKVVDCVQTGYTLNDKVIRHAKVAVGQ